MQWSLPPDAPTQYATTAETVTDQQTGLEWQRVVPAEALKWSSAKAYCNELQLAGKSDWRLPTVVELRSIVDFTRYNPAINGDAFPNTPADWFWSSTPHAYYFNQAWVVHFNNGLNYFTFFINTYRVRCVR